MRWTRRVTESVFRVERNVMSIAKQLGAVSSEQRVESVGCLFIYQYTARCVCVYGLYMCMPVWLRFASVVPISLSRYWSKKISLPKKWLWARCQSCSGRRGGNTRRKSGRLQWGVVCKGSRDVCLQAIPENCMWQALFGFAAAEPKLKLMAGWVRISTLPNQYRNWAAAEGVSGKGVLPGMR